MNTKYNRHYSVSIQNPWDREGLHVEIAVGGRDAISPGLTKVILEDTVDPVEAAEAAIAASKERGIPIDYASIMTYSDGDPNFDYDAVMVRAKEARAKCIRCDYCGEIVNQTYTLDDDVFCGDLCYENWEDFNRTYYEERTWTTGTG